MIPSIASAKVLWSGDFDTCDTSQWTRSQYQGAPTLPTDRLQVLPGDEGCYLKATVRAGDLHSNGARAEVLETGLMFHEGDDVWFRWKTLFPADFVASSKWIVWTQWHQTLSLGNGGPPLAFTLSGEQLRMRVQTGLYDAKQDWSGGIFWRAPLERGVWKEYILHVKWSQSMYVGFTELWVDGELALPKKMHSNLDTDGVVYMKQGLYRDRSITGAQSVLHDGMIVADSAADVFPAEEPEVPGETEPDAGVPPIHPADPDGGTDAGQDPVVPDAGTPPLSPADPPNEGCGGTFSFTVLGALTAFGTWRFRTFGR